MRHNYLITLSRPLSTTCSLDAMTLTELSQQATEIPDFLHKNEILTVLARQRKFETELKIEAHLTYRYLESIDSKELYFKKL